MQLVLITDKSLVLRPHSFSHNIFHSSIDKVSARRMKLIFAEVSNASASAVGMCKPEERELRRVFLFCAKPALMSLKKVFNKLLGMSGSS